MVLAGSLVGLGFLAKMMQAFFVVPAFGLVYLLAAPTPVRRRIWQLLLAGVAMFVAAAWWVVAVTLTPASARPYIGGSQHNSILELIFGYNGFGRLTGNETGSVTGGGAAGGIGGGTGGGSMWGPTGITRLFGSEMGTQISWLIPAALGHAARRVVALPSRRTHQQAARRDGAVGRDADRESVSSSA